MLGERPIAEYGIVLAALTALVMVVRAILTHLKYVHNTTPKGSNNGLSVMKAHVEDIVRQINNIRSETKETLAMHKVTGKDGVPVWYNRESDKEIEAQRHKEHQHKLNECVTEQRKTNTLLEKFISLNTQEHNIIIRDIGARLNSFSAPKNK